MVLASVDCSLRAAYVLLATFSELLLALLDAADSLHLSRRLKALHLRKKCLLLNLFATVVYNLSGMMRYQD